MYGVLMFAGVGAGHQAVLYEHTEQEASAGSVLHTHRATQFPSEASRCTQTVSQTRPAPVCHPLPE